MVSTLDGVDRLVVLSDQPDDLAGSELVAAAVARGVEVVVVPAVDDGTDDGPGLTAALVQAVGTDVPTAVLAPRRDGDGPHRAAAAACRRTDAVLWELAGAGEQVVVTAPEDCPDSSLDDLHVGDPDPWGTTRRRYERRKRDLLLAALPRERHGRALEVGCSVGELAAALRTRVDALVAVDASPAAVAVARERLGDDADVRLLDVPREWPEGGFDLVVVSEAGYFLSPRALDRLVDRVEASLGPGGTLVLCHWRHPMEGWPLDGPDVHERIARRLADRLPLQASYADRDVELRVHTSDATWPAPDA